jgi:type IV pilus assembly protein PilB
MTIIKELAKRKILDKTKAAELEIEAKTSGKKEEEILLEKGLVDEERIFSIKSELLKIPLKRINSEEISTEILSLIPEETAKFYKMVPLKKDGENLEVGMVWPEDIEAKEALKFLARRSNLKTKIFLITLSDFKRLIEKYRVTPKEIEEALEKIEKEVKIEKRPTMVEIERIVEEAPIVKAVSNILRYGIEGQASDIHIEPVGEKTKVRFRILGKLFSTLTFPIKIHPAIVGRIKVMANLRLDETRIPQDGRFSQMYEGRKIDFRVSTFPTTRGEKIVLRILDPRMGLKKVEELGLRGRNFKVLERGMKKPYGMILATGPTGCGKTTTLYAILQKLNKEDVNIVTLEDPVEYLIEGINQSQIRPEIGYDFAKGLRHVLRQDPDIIMVGEIRDSETAFLATHAALTGHLVLSTLHTNNAIGAVPRLLDLGVPKFLIPATLNLVLAQRLVRVLCPKCKKKVRAKRNIETLILKELEDLPEKIKQSIEIPKKIYVFEPKGCKDCDFKGFVGRIGIFEILEMNRELEETILKEPSETKILKVAKQQGMITMRQDGILKVLEGKTSIEEVLRETGE